MLTILGYSATEPQIRRQVKRTLKQQALLPLYRPIKIQDYKRLKFDIMTSTESQALV